jgi:hypothetical protein
MPSYDYRVDAYIYKSAPFAQPVILHLREFVHEVHPDVAETLKWGMPHFDYKGTMCGFAAFENDCTFGFWKSALPADPHGVLQDTEKAAMDSFGRMTGLQDLPADPIFKG